MHDTQVSIIGNVATDIRYVKSDRGTPLASFRLASTPRRYDRAQGGWVDGRTTFVTVVCWRSLAEHVGSSLHKGEPVLVLGRLRVDSWERDGRTGTSVEVEAQTVGHDLSRGTSVFRRARREEVERSSDVEAAEHLARSWESGGTETPAGEDPGRSPGTADVGVVQTRPGATPTHPRSAGRSPRPADSEASSDADGRAA